MRIYIIGNDGITLSREAPTALDEGEMMACRLPHWPSGKA